MKFVGMLGLVCALGSCSTVPDVGSFVASAGAPALEPVSAKDGRAQRGQDLALVALPSQADAAVRVDERVYPNGVRQEIDLGDSGDRIEINIGSSRGSRSVDALALEKPSAEGIHTEILAAFPRMQMEIVRRPLFDRLGPIGLAIGRDASGLRCVFAWQWIDDLSDSDPSRATIFKIVASWRGAPAHASIRVRLCRRDRTLDQLAAAVGGLGLSDPKNLTRVLAVSRADRGSDGVIASGALLAPLPQSLEDALGPFPQPPVEAADGKSGVKRPDPGRSKRLAGELPARAPGTASESEGKRRDALRLPEQAFAGPLEGARAAPGLSGASGAQASPPRRVYGGAGPIGQAASASNPPPL